MKFRALLLCASALWLGACVSSPKQTVLNLDTADPQWSSRRCIAARKAAARYDDGETTRGVVEFLGNLAAPFAGTGAALAMSASKDGDRAGLNRQIRANCVSDPLRGRRLSRVAR
jgi:hypothetical protein